MKEIKITKQEVINKVEDLEEDNVALWHFMQSNEKEIERLEKKVVELKNEWDKLKEKIWMLGRMLGISKLYRRK